MRKLRLLRWQRCVLSLTPLVCWVMAVGVLGSRAEAQMSRSALGIYDPRVFRGVDDHPTNRQQLGVLLPVATSVASTMGNIGNYMTIQPTARFGRVILDATGIEQIEVEENQGGYFSQPAWTLSEGQTSLSLSYLHLNFDEFDGKSLDSAFDEFQPFSNGVAFADFDSTFSLEADVFLLSYARGITNDLELSFIVPFIDLSGSGSATAFFTIPNESNLESIANNSFAVRSPFSESDSGIGDVIFRTKYALIQEADRSFALGADLVLPTGDEDKYLGGGDFGYRIRGLYAKKLGNFYPTVELGYYWSNLKSESGFPIDESDFDQLEYRLGVPYRLTDKITVGTEWIGYKSDAFTQNDIAIFGRWDMEKCLENLVIDMGVRIPVDEDGIRPSVAPAVSIQYSY